MHFSNHKLDFSAIAKIALYIPEGQADHHTTTHTPHARQNRGRGAVKLKRDVVYITSLLQSQINFSIS